MQIIRTAKKLINTLIELFISKFILFEYYMI